MKLNQNVMPLAKAMEEYRDARIVSFDVPGHKKGKSSTDLVDFFGAQTIKIDANSMKSLDFLAHPVSVIKEAEELMADAFGADHCFFMVGGTTSSVQAMVMASLKEGDKIIMPRNVHKSAINALILIGAVPIYVNPGIHKQLGIPLGMNTEDVIAEMDKNPDAKAVLVNHPTYYGICSELEKIVDEAHKRGILVLADEAHGTHFYFNEKLPKSAMEVGCDMAAVSIHKTGGSLTQSSVLLLKKNRVNPDYVRTIINITQTTSPSYLLMGSLDIARHNLAVNGKEIFEKVIELCEYAREEINKVDGYYAFGKEIIDNKYIYDFDTTKLCINTQNIGLAGIEVYDKLRDDYGIQMELGDLSNTLAIVSVGDTKFQIERLCASLSEIKRRFSQNSNKLFKVEYIEPIIKKTPKQAFYGNVKKVKINDAIGEISGEFVMAYPPGIPIVAPGELITEEICKYIKYSKEKGCLLLGTLDMELEYINVLE
ncbi:MAG: aminotransferase class I/II-fold pyridoxal phosphate-dependent enzyme [Lachnospirales bacterium]